MRAAEFVSEEWSAKYKRSIDCSHPKGFSQRAHCAGRKKNEDIDQELHIGDPVVITGDVQFQGKTGDIDSFGTDKRFVVVNLYNYGPHSFHSSDVSYNDYADQDDEQLDELTFKGSPCTKDCSGHRAGYEWSRRKGGQDAASWSRSFNNGAALFKNGF